MTEPTGAVPRNRRAGRYASAALIVLFALGSGWGSDRESASVQIRTLLDDGRFVEAEQRGHEALLTLEQASKGDTLEAAAVLDLLVEAIGRQDRGYSSDVKTMAERALRIKERGLAYDDPALAPSLANVAMVRINVDLDLEGAFEMSRRALDVARSRFAPGDPRLARYLTLHAGVLRNKSEAANAREMLDEALALLDDGAPTLLRMDVLKQSGLMAYVTSDIRAVIAAYDQAAVVVEDAFGPDHPEVARLRME